MKDIIVVGSLNMDLVMQAAKLPKLGETILCNENYKMIPGGKGANQAVAVAKLGGKSIFVGRRGNDSFGNILADNLKKSKVITDYITIDKNAPTGMVLVMLDEKGNNSILLSAGANRECCKKDVDKIKPILAKASILVLQLEIPFETVSYAIALANKYNVPVLLDAGPARKLPNTIFKKINIISPNETETEALIGVKIKDIETAKIAAKKFLKLGVKTVILKLGGKGALLATEKEIHYIKGVKVKAVDTTAAGDAFTGALAVAYTQGKNLQEAVTYANYVGALTVTKLGAQPSIPTKEEVEIFMKKK